MGLHVNTFFKERRKTKRSFPTGTVLFTGLQGAGKTLSATFYIWRLKQKFPNVYIYSNIKLKIADKVIRSDEVADYILDRKIEGEACGDCSGCKGDSFELCINQTEIPIIFFIDEIQTVLNSKKNSVSLEVFESICQQRKANKAIIGTLQMYLDLDIAYRRQVKFSVDCFHFGSVQLELWRDGQSLKYNKDKNDYIGKTDHLEIWKRHNDIFDMYDTYEIVSQVMNQDPEKAQSLRKKGIQQTAVVELKRK